MRFIFIYEYTLSYFTGFRLKARLGSAANQRLGSFFSKSPAFPAMNFSSAAAERDA